MFKIIADGKEVEDDDLSEYDEPQEIEYYLEKGNKIVEDVEVGFEYSKLKVTSSDFETSERLIQHSIFEFPENIILDFTWGKIDDYTLILEIFNTPSNQRKLFTELDQEEKSTLYFQILPDLSNWKRKYSFIEYKKELLGNLQSQSESKFNIQINDNQYTEFSSVNFSIGHNFLNDDSQKLSIKEELEKYVLFFKEIHQLTSNELEEITFENLVVTAFNFPENLKIPCEQYLLYFAQFLKDLGINATSNLKEEAGKVLFSVTPTDDVEALDKIREALAVYLKLPESPISEIEYSENFALMRLQQQVRNLQHSQQMTKTELLSAQYALRLAQKNIDNQDQFITRQNSFIENQNKIIEKITDRAIMINSAENKEEFEEIYEGVKVGESKWLKELTGIGLNPAKAIKTAVKNTFGKDEKITSLGLKED